MAEEKRFFWLKLEESFFDDKIIKYLLAQEEGAKIVNAYLRLQLRSLKTGGLIAYDGIYPTCEEEIAFDLSEELEFIKKVVALLEKCRLVERLENGSIYIIKVSDLVASEGASARRKREQKGKVTDYSQREGNPFRQESDMK